MAETSYTLELCLKQPLMRVDEWYQRGLVSREIVEQYCELWNASPHFTKAVLRDGAIRLISDPRTQHLSGIHTECDRTTCAHWLKVGA